jgi:hypothetical protein
MKINEVVRAIIEWASMVSKLCVHFFKIKHSSLFGWLVLE